MTERATESLRRRDVLEAAGRVAPDPAARIGYRVRAMSLVDRRAFLEARGWRRVSAKSARGRDLWKHAGEVGDDGYLWSLVEAVVFELELDQRREARDGETATG